MIQAIRERRGLQIFGLMFPGGFWLLVFFAIPLLMIAVISFMSRDALGNPALPFTLKNYADTVGSDGLYLKLFWFSLWLSFVSTLLTLLIAFPVALFIARSPKKWRNTLVFAVMIPFWTNFLIRTYALQFLLKANGPINATLNALNIPPLDLLSTPQAVMIGLVYGNLPFMILPLYTSLEKFDWSMLEAASDLGANTFRAFLRVMLPLTAPGLVAGSILTFVPSVGSYITVELMGGGKSNMIGRTIAAQFSDVSNWPFGSAMSLVLMVIVTIAALVYFRTSSGEQRTAV